MSHEYATRRGVAQNPLAPFNPESTCPKCGHDDVGTLYQAGTKCPSPTPDSCPAECLLRACRRCHYGWAEAVTP